jgi:Cdc25 family phosphatase
MTLGGKIEHLSIVKNERKLEDEFDILISGISNGYNSKIEYMTSNDLIEHFHDVLIIDCRDDDYVGGHIKGAIHISSLEFGLKPVFSMNKILEIAKSKNTKNVVFHCMESQKRSPKCANNFKIFLKFIRETSWNIFVLEGGFDRWIRKYNTNPDLVENFNDDYWCI